MRIVLHGAHYFQAGVGVSNRAASEKIAKSRVFVQDWLFRPTLNYVKQTTLFLRWELPRHPQDSFVNRGIGHQTKQPHPKPQNFPAILRSSSLSLGDKFPWSPPGTKHSTPPLHGCCGGAGAAKRCQSTRAYTQTRQQTQYT